MPGAWTELDSSVVIAVLGPFRLRTTAGMTRLPSQVTRRILGTLVLSPSHEAGAERISAAVWGTKRPRSRSALQVAIHRCRTLLHANGVGVRIETTLTGYRLELGGWTTDIDAFTHLVDRAGDLELALELWRGPVFADDVELASHFRGQIAVLDLRRRAAVLELTHKAIADGDMAKAVDLVRTALHDDPLDEQASAAYIQAVASMGRPSEAVAEFERVSAALSEQLGLRPGRQLLSIYERHVIAPDLRLRSDLADHRDLQESVFPRPATSQTG